ncbi:hypothetical protein [Scytonema sp. NUACC26]|uniref:hypothetical protein n=1 Tax=Scytonema sp. NUACC26 TaxID=3140176 RepID=UPI0038B23EA1
MSLAIGDWELGIGHWALGIGGVGWVEERNPTLKYLVFVGLHSNILSLLDCIQISCFCWVSLRSTQPTIIFLS